MEYSIYDLHIVPRVVPGLQPLFRNALQLYVCTVEPPDRENTGAANFFLSSEVLLRCIYKQHAMVHRNMRGFHCWESALSEVSLYACRQASKEEQEQGVS